MSGTGRLFERVLVVDDDERVLLQISKALSKRGYSVATALNLSEAEKELNQGVDLVLTDVRLDGESGWDIADAASNIRPVPAVIAMSGLAQPDEILGLGHRAVVGYLAKPFEVDDLLNAFDKAANVEIPIEPFVARQVGQKPIGSMVKDVRQVMTEQAIALASGSIRAAAKILGISRQALQQIIRRKKDQ